MNRFLSTLRLLPMLMFVSSVSVTALAHHDHHDHQRADLFAPIGVMGDHMHPAGTLMMSYRFQWMDMAGNRDGTTSLTNQAVRDRGYMVVPTEMTMQMHMFGLMFAPTDWFTVMTMLPVMVLSMDHLAGMPLGDVSFTTDTAGIGDIGLAGLFRLIDTAMHRFHFNGALTLPTGAIHVRGATPMDPNARLPYPMRLGTGSLSLNPGLTYLGLTKWISWGTQVQGRFPLYKNEDGYRASIEGHFTGWAAFNPLRWFSVSTRLLGIVRSNYDGADSDLDPGLVPTADPALRGGSEVHLLFGINLLAPSESFLSGHQFGVEGGIPVYLDLDGPQLEPDWTITAGWKWDFFTP